MLGVTTTFGSLPTDKLLSVFVDRKIRFSLNIFFQVMVVKKGGKNKNYDQRENFNIKKAAACDMNPIFENIGGKLCNNNNQKYMYYDKI